MGKMNEFGKVKVISVVIGALVVASAGGYAVYASYDKTEETAVVEEKKAEPPVIEVYGKKLVVGIGTEISLQDKVVKSISSEEEIKSVTVEQKSGMTVTDVKEGKVKNGVPAKTLKFTKEGTYVVNITVEDSEGGKTVMPVTFEVGAELLSYVEGIKDWTVEVGSKDVDFMKDVKFDKEHVKEVTCDSSKVDLSKAGTYDLTYNIKGIINNEETSIKKVVNVKTISKEEAKKEADKGNQVVTSNNDVKKDSKGNVPTGGVSSEISSEAVTRPSGGGSASKPSGNDSKPSGGGSSKPSNDNKPSGGGSSNKPSNDTPKHEHTWVTVNHPAETHVVHHPAETRQEDQGHYESVKVSDGQYVPNEQVRHICNTCGADVTGNENPHAFDHLDRGEKVSWSDAVVDMGGYYTDPVYENRWVPNVVTVVVRDAWDETVVDRAAWSETTCSGCGASR